MRGFRRASAFRPISSGERRNAELFYADLVGRNTSDSPRLRVNSESFFEDLTGRVRNCPEDVVQAAERQWGSRIPFTKRDPPVCF